MRSCGITLIGLVGVLALPVVLFSLARGEASGALLTVIVAGGALAWYRLAASRYRKGGMR